MNIYELEKQATPGPWFGTQSTVLGHTTPEVTRETHICSTDENWLPHDEQDANGKLIRHCRNNFMKALEALKRLQRGVVGTEGMTASEADEFLCSVIEELEEVK